MASQVICTGTAWAESRASPEPFSDPPAPGTNLQFGSPGLDASFLADVYVILSGIKYDDIISAWKAEQPIDIGHRRIAGIQLAPYHVAHLYECSAELRSRIASLSPERIEDIARNWHVMLRHPVESSPSRIERRLEIIQNLAALARVADRRGSRLLLRVEYKDEHEL